MTTIEEVQALHERICNQARSLCAQRGEEYANPADTLLTFRQAGEMLNLHPSVIVDNMIAVKISRLFNGELKLDTIYDLINYLVYKVILTNGSETGCSTTQNSQN